MPIVHVNGQTLHYTDTGGNKPVLIFSHGLLMDYSMFEAQVSEFSRDYRCICWDERGHGLTGDAKAPFSYYDSANDAVALLEYLGVEQAVFLGMSQGGFLSLRAALKHPDMVHAIVLLDSQAGVEDPELMPGYQALIGNWASNGLSAETATTLCHIIGGPDFDGAPWIAKWEKINPSNLLQIFHTLGARDQIIDQLDQLTIPVLIVYGDCDAAVSLDRVQATHDALPNARLEIIKGAGHAANMTHATEVNAAIRSFLASLSELQSSVADTSVAS